MAEASGQDTELPRILGIWVERNVSLDEGEVRIEIARGFSANGKDNHGTERGVSQVFLHLRIEGPGVCEFDLECAVWPRFEAGREVPLAEPDEEGEIAAG